MLGLQLSSRRRRRPAFFLIYMARAWHGIRIRSLDFESISARYLKINIKSIYIYIAGRAPRLTSRSTVTYSYVLVNIARSISVYRARVRIAIVRIRNRYQIHRYSIMKTSTAFSAMATLTQPGDHSVGAGIDRGEPGGQECIYICAASSRRIRNSRSR